MTSKEEVYANTLNPLYPTNNNQSGLYPTNNNQSGETECALYESTPENVYQDVDADNKTVHSRPQDDSTYDYAVVDGSIRMTDATRSEGTPEGNKGLQHDREEQKEDTLDTNERTESSNIYHVLQEP